MRRPASIWMLALLPAMGCSELEPRASSAGVQVGEPGREARPEDRPSPTNAAASCEALRRETRQMLVKHCAPCHQAPANQANFSFCLDVDALARAVSSTGKRFLVPGFPEQSRMFERVANREMPPAIVTQRPTEHEVASLRQWITSCVVLGAEGLGKLDAGARPDVVDEPEPGPGCGKPRQPCCGANSCEGGGCCVLGYCRAEGQTCPGGPGGDEVPGTCAAGSCVTSGIACGGRQEACCGVVRSCTAPGVVCPMGHSICQPCGEEGGPCCRNGGLSTCRDGLDCVNNAYPNPGTCAPCGGAGQACCGDGPAGRRHCSAGLACRFAGGTAFLCDSADAGP